MISSDMLSDNMLVVTCVLLTPQPFGAKHGAQHRNFGFGSKGVRMLEHDILRAERLGQPIVSCVRTPANELRHDVQELITSSFAPGVAPLIHSAIEAAYQ